MNVNCVMHSKYVVFDESKLPIRTFKRYIVPHKVIEVHDEYCALDNMSRIVLAEIDYAMRESEDDSDSLVQASERNRH